MSRNLGRTDCYFCNSDVELLEQPRPVTVEEVRPYEEYYVGMLTVANAWCPQCEAKYLAWVDHSGANGHMRRTPDDDRLFVDLSFRSSFNDEPGFDDLPKYNVVHVPTRTGPFDGHWKKWFDEHPDFR